MFMDFNMLLHFQIITKAFFAVRSWPKIYSIILQESFYKYILQNQRRISFTEIIFAKYQRMPYNQMEMLDDDNSRNQLCLAFKKLKGSKINRIVTNYAFSANYHSDVIRLEDEYTLAQFITFCPPSISTFKNQSVNFLKVLYIECYINPNYVSAQIDFDNTQTINNGITQGLYEYFYKSFNKGINKYLCAFGVNKLMCSILSFFEKTQYVFRFDHTVIELNKKLGNSVGIHKFLIFLMLLYFLVVVVWTWATSYETGKLNDGSEGEGLPTISHITYLVFALITLIAEYKIYNLILNDIRHLIPEVQLSPGSGRLNRWKIKIISYILNIWGPLYKKVLYFQYLFNSQLLRLDLYTDMAFAIVCFQGRQYSLAWASLSLVSLNCITMLIEIFSVIFSKKDRRGVTGRIDQLYEASLVLEFSALSKVLSRLTPFTVYRIPKWKFLGYGAGKTIEHSIINSFFRILFDISQILIQFTYMGTGVNISWVVYLSAVTSFYSASYSTWNFLTIRPSIVTQYQFNQLKKEKQLFDEQKIEKDKLRILEEKKEETLLAEEREKCLFNKQDGQKTKMDENQENFQMKDFNEKLSVKDINLQKKEENEEQKLLLKNQDQDIIKI
eukprot:TRINITY_DN6015_c0_g1_i4.p1 TRINITY_DN6015_c0_g1~~TRINITY_DN6015_c0_g1_i4.p1  ORF type:complete len:613 (+),score=76.40 TRINITY_DN6015_c0_g1_i4:674-2512(+)